MYHVNLQNIGGGGGLSLLQKQLIKTGDLTTNFFLNMYLLTINFLYK